MRRDLQIPTLVVTGAWNPAIFQVGWILDHLFEVERGTKVQIAQVVRNTNDGPQTIYYYEQLGIHVSDRRLEIFVNSEGAELAARAEGMAARVFEVLPHTPVSAFGTNFVFIEPQPSDAVIDKLKTHERLEQESFKLKAQRVLSTFGIDVNTDLNFSRVIDGDSVRFDFNYSTGCGTAANGPEVVRGAIYRYLEQSLNVLRKYYELETYDLETFLIEPAAKQERVEQ